MRRSVVAALLLAVPLAAAGCSREDKHFEVLLDVDGGGRATQVAYAIPGATSPTTAKDVQLPWHLGAVPEALGAARIDVVPAKGVAAHCRITVNHRQLADASGQPGAPVHCAADITKYPAPSDS
jgi:hypothetical protein